MLWVPLLIGCSYVGVEDEAFEKNKLLTLTKKEDTHTMVPNKHKQ